jgi:tetratricopeptide (TPR) repeat protein
MHRFLKSRPAIAMWLCGLLLAACGSEESAEKMVERARQHMQFKEYNEAIALCDKAIAAQADFGPAYETKGKALHIQGKAEDALTVYTAWVAAAPADAYGYFFQGRLQLELGKDQDALASGDKLVELAPDGAESYALRGAARLRAGNESGAAEDAKRATENDPKCLNALLLTGELALADYRYGDAEKTANTAIKLEARNVDALLLRARSALELDSFNKASDAIDVAKEAGGDAYLSYWHWAAAVALAADKFERAEAMIAGYEKMCAGGPDNPTAQLMRADLAFLQGKHDDALAIAQKAGDSAGAALMRARILLALGKYDEATEQANIAIKAADTAATRLQKAEILLLRGDATAAEAEADAAVQLRPHCADAVELRAKARLARGKFNDAMADIRKRTEMRPESLYAITARCELRMRLKQGWDKTSFEGALSTAQNRIDSYPRPALRHLDLARLHCVALHNVTEETKRAEHLDKALEHVTKARKAGLAPRDIADRDPILDPLVKDPRYADVWK